jgi:acetylornithine deacetylase/succinyl-diaminopimelate desuccinylase-like protein
MLDTQSSTSLIESSWQSSILPELESYIRIPNKSPLFDPDWAAHGYMDDAVDMMAKWAKAQDIADMQVEVVRLEGRTPLIYIEIPGTGERTVVLYGHLDKQPEMTGWREGLGPWIPVFSDDKLYGRGGADDGYALYASLTAVRALQAQHLPHANLRVIIEASEESGSPDLPFYVDALAERIGKPDLVVCLDSGCGNYDQLWCTTSLRGMVGGELSVKVLEEGVHSGDASGIVPSSFRILRQLLGRIEDEYSGRVLIDELHVDIPAERQAQAAYAAQVLGDSVYDKFPFIAGTQAASDDLKELVLNRTWRPALAMTGIGGVPSLGDAGNVLRPGTTLKLSMRIPPTCNVEQANQALKTLLEQDPPYGAAVKFHAEKAGPGWNAPPLADWLGASLDTASQATFGKPCVYMGEGGSIPFMGMLGEKFPAAQFLVTGVLGPQSNAHGPNEFLHIPTAKKITGCVSQVLHDHYLTTTESE